MPTTRNQQRSYSIKIKALKCAKSRRQLLPSFKKILWEFEASLQGIFVKIIVPKN